MTPGQHDTRARVHQHTRYAALGFWLLVALTPPTTDPRVLTGISWALTALFVVCWALEFHHLGKARDARIEGYLDATDPRDVHLIRQQSGPFAPQETR